MMNNTMIATNYEQTILAIVRSLPSDRLPNLIEYARFLEFQVAQEADEVQLEGDVAWDRLLATPESNNLLQQMAETAQAEYVAGQTTGIAVSDDGQLEPR